MLTLAPQGALAEHGEDASASTARAAAPGTGAGETEGAVTSSRSKARRLLAGMQQALASRTYVGTAVHERYFESTHKRHTEVLRIAQRVRGREQRERIEFLTGEPRELLRSSVGDRSESLCIFADRGLVLDGASARAAAPRMPVPEGALDRYRITSGPGGRLAGRHTDQVTLTPRDGYRYGHRLWVDRQSQLPLQTETFRLLEDASGAGSPRDKVLERFYYTELALPDHLDDAVLAPRLMDASLVERRRLRLLEVSQRGADAGRRVRLLDTTRLTPLSSPSASAEGEADAEVATLRWKTWLPPGFLPMQGTRPTKGQSHRVYSDGLASLSIFVEPGMRPGLAGSDRAAGPERSQLGVLNAVSLETADLRVTVVGDVPARTAERIARSVQRR